MAPMKRPASGPPSDWAGTLSFEQLARRWKSTPKAIRQLLGTQQLPFIQIRGSFRIPLSDVEQYEQQHPLPPGEKPKQL